MTILGLAVCLACILGMTWGLYHLVRTGTCASGGPYVSARPCPAGTGAKIGVLMGSIFVSFVGLGIFAARGSRRGGGSTGGTVGLGVVMWSLLFISLAAATIVAAYGPANNDDPGARTAAIVLAIVFLPMGILPLLGAAGLRGRSKRLKGRLGGGGDAPLTYPKPAPPPVQPGAPPAAPFPTAAQAAPAAAPLPEPGMPADPVERLRKLDELRDAGLLTDEEFDAKKAEILRRM